MSAPSFTRFIQARPGLMSFLKPIAARYTDLSGYRKMGLLYDDLIREETPVVQQAIKRLPPKLAYDRVFRIRRALQLSMQHQLLPTHEQTKAEDDIAYLTPYIEEVEREIEERQMFDSMTKSK